MVCALIDIMKNDIDCFFWVLSTMTALGKKKKNQWILVTPTTEQINIGVKPDHKHELSFSDGIN